MITYKQEMQMLTILAIIVTTLISENPTMSCSCRISHPQQHFCHSDYVIQAKVMKSSPKSTLNYKGIHIRVKKVFKVTEKARVALKSQVIWTAGEESLCGINLVENEKYLLAGKLVGKKAWLSLCNYAVKWKSLSRKQKKGFRMLYKHGCKCKIRSCPEYIRSCPKSKSICSWNSLYDGRYDCQSLQSYCIPQKTGQCGWNTSKVYRNCLKVREKAKSKQREIEYDDI